MTDDHSGHPCEDESCSDSVFRFLNEMDFVGQKRATNIAWYGQVLTAVSHWYFMFDFEAVLNSTYTRYYDFCFRSLAL